MAFSEDNPKYKHGLFHVRTVIILIVAVQSMFFWYELLNFGVTRNSDINRSFQSTTAPIYRKRNYSDTIINGGLLSKNASFSTSDDLKSKIKEYDKFCAGAWNPVRGRQFPDIATMLYDGMMLLFCVFVVKAVRLTIPKLLIPKLACDLFAAYTSGFTLAKMLIDPLVKSIPSSQAGDFWYTITLNCWCTLVNCYIFHISWSCYKYLNEKRQFFEQTALDIITAVVVSSNNRQRQNQTDNVGAETENTVMDLPPAYPSLVAQENAPTDVEDGHLPTYEEVERSIPAPVKPA